jgi:hypothetical protein
MFVLAALQLTIGCATSRECTEVGFQSGVGVSLPNASWRLVEFCIDATCDEAVVPHPDGRSIMGLIPVGDDPEEYAYRLTAVKPDGDEVSRRGVVQTETYYMNGKGCDPETANADLVLAPDGSVTVRHP